MKNADTFEMNKNWTALCTSQAGDANQEQHSLAKFMMECTIGIQGIRCILPCLCLFTPDHQQGSTTWRINLPPLWQPPLFCFHSS